MLQPQAQSLSGSCSLARKKFQRGSISCDIKITDSMHTARYPLFLCPYSIFPGSYLTIRLLKTLYLHLLLQFGGIIL